MRRRLDVTLRWSAICGLYVLWALALTVSWLLAQPRDAALWFAARADAAITELRAEMDQPRRRFTLRHVFTLGGGVSVWALIVLAFRSCT